MAKSTLTTSAKVCKVVVTFLQTLPVMVTSRSIWEMSGKQGSDPDSHSPAKRRIRI